MAMNQGFRRGARWWPLVACVLLAACSKGPQPGEVQD
jgi:hypothetical protein